MNKSSKILLLEQGFLLLTFLTKTLHRGNYRLHYRMLSRISGLYPLDFSRALPSLQLVTLKSVSRLCQMSLGGTLFFLH